MRNKIFITLFIFLLIIQIATSQLQGITKDDVFKTLKTNLPLDAEATLTIDNPEPYSLQKDSLQFRFTEDCGTVIRYKLLRKTTCARNKPIYETKQYCNDFKNGTVCEDGTIITGTYPEFYQCFTPTQYIYSGESDYKIEADIKADTCNGAWGYRIDWLPTLLIDNITFEKPEWAWWNVSLASRRNITNLTDNQVALAINGTNGVAGRTVWFNPRTANNSNTNVGIYYNTTPLTFTLANDTTQYSFETEGKPYNKTPTNIYHEKANVVYHFGKNHTTYTNDSTFYKHQAVVEAPASNWTNGSNCIFGGCYILYGDRITITDHTLFTGHIMPNISISMWVRLRHVDNTDLGTAPRLIDKRTGGATQFTVVLTNFDKIDWIVNTVGVANSEVVSPNAMVVDVWYNMVFDYNGTDQRMFINGTLVNSSIFAGGNMTGGVSNGMSIGGRSDDKHYLNGTIDEVRIWNNSLPASVYQEMYNNTIYLNNQLGIEQSAFGDTQAPRVNQTEPPNNTQVITLTPEFNYTYADETSNGTCTVIVNGTNVNTTTAINDTLTTVTSNTTLTNFSWYEWYMNCSDGTNTNVSDTWIFFLSTCIETWVQYNDSCNTSNKMLYLYNDTTGCGSNINLPANNGTTVACNYCNETLVESLTPCVNGTQNQTWIDTNFANCCFLTGNTTDCSVLYTPPFNESTPQNCTASTLISNFTCYLDENPFLKDKMNFVCEMPDNDTYCCVANVYSGTDDLLATTPEYQDASNSLLAFRSEEETRTCFTPVQRLVNGYYTTKSVRTETRFTLEMLCTELDGTTIRSQYTIRPEYERPDWIMHRWIWITRNWIWIIAILFTATLLTLFTGYLYRKARRGY